VTTNLWVSALVALAVVLVTFTIGAARNLHRIIDIAWGLGFSAIAITTYVLSSGVGNPAVRGLVTALTVIWGVRLSAHIFLRSRGHGEDPRYERLLSKGRGSRNSYALRMVYLLQAGVMWFVSLPVQIAQYDTSAPSWWLVPGVALWAIGFGFESIGDYQLYRFAADPANRSRTLDTGLWRYTRHPNYFGDACVWWGLYLLACTSWWGAATILSPVVMTYFLALKTGKPMLEESLARRRPGYAEYIQRTSGFIPWPPRRIS
jgi:steroid 5-alpha reductase family enzyme